MTKNQAPRGAGPAGRRLMSLLVLILAAAGLVGTSTAPASAAPRVATPAGWTRVLPDDVTALAVPGLTTIRSQATGLYTSAELEYTDDNYAMLRARAATASGWEGFIFTWTGNVWTIQAQATGLYVSTEVANSGNGYGMLRARAFSAGAWEGYNILTNGITYVIQSNANGMYVTVESGFTGDTYGMLRARSSSIGPLQLFYL